MRPITKMLSDLHTGETHRAGAVSFDVIQAIERLCEDMPVNRSIETGCGLTTIALSNISKKHVVFAVDDRGTGHSSVLFAMSSPAYRAEACQHVFGPTQLTLPAYPFESTIDFVLIDGPHGFPYPQLEYFHVFPHLRTGAILAIDDIDIPHIWSMFSCLAEDDMFEFVDIVDGRTGFLRRTDALAVSPEGDDWYLQRHNFKGWPMAIMPDSTWLPEEAIDFRLKGNAQRFMLLGWARRQDWGCWSDGTEASLSFRWPEVLQADDSVSVESLYSARGDVIVLLNDRVIGSMPGFPVEEMRRHAIAFSLRSSDLGRTNILKFSPTSVFSVAMEVGDRKYGIALTHLRYRVG